MIEVLDGTMVYATIDEKIIVDKLFRVKAPSAIYYKESHKVAYHWNLHPITVAKLKIAHK